MKGKQRRARHRQTNKQSGVIHNRRVAWASDSLPVRQTNMARVPRGRSVRENGMERFDSGPTRSETVAACVPPNYRAQDANRSYPAGSPAGASETSPGREPGVSWRCHEGSPGGAAEANKCRPAGAFRSGALLYPRLTPWATFFRPFGTGEPDTGSVRLNTVGARHL
jgi:hypothetical protein